MIRPSRSHAFRVALASLLSAALLIAGCATNPVTGEPDFVLMSEQRELALGKQYHGEILKQYSVYEDDALQAYVSGIGQRLAAKSHRPDIEYTFTVLDSPEVNAFALPGGYVYITRGIMAYFNSEAELAGVLGHELGHVTARHSVRQQSAATASSVLGGILLGAAGAGRGAAELFQTVQLAAIRGYGRDQELEADRLGAEYLARSGYDSQEMLDVVRILADQEDYERRRAEAEGRQPNVYHGVFASHPDNDARLQEVIRAARKHETGEARTEGRAEYLRRIEGMTYGPGADQGMVADHKFLHLTLDAALAAPRDWTIVNQPRQIVFVAPDNAGRLQVTLAEAAADASPRELLRERVGGRIERGRAFDANGLPGYTGVALRDTEIGRRPVRFTVVLKDDRAWHFAAITRAPDAFDRHDDAFLDIAGSLRTLTQAERRTAEPLRIEIVETAAATRYAQLAAPLEPRLDDPVARLRLLNGDWPDGSAASKALIKTLR